VWQSSVRSVASTRADGNGLAYDRTRVTALPKQWSSGTEDTAQREATPLAALGDPTDGRRRITRFRSRRGQACGIALLVSQESPRDKTGILVDATSIFAHSQFGRGGDAAGDAATSGTECVDASFQGQHRQQM
jgi:hypothetical protein